MQHKFKEQEEIFLHNAVSSVNENVNYQKEAKNF